MASNKYRNFFKRQFVPYEIACELIKLGLDYNIFDCTYGKSRGEYCVISDLEWELKDTGAWFPTEVLAFTWQEAFAWFRDTKGAQSYIRFNQGYGEKSHSYKINDMFRMTDKYVFEGEGTTFEKAQLQCIEKLIELYKK